MDAIETAPPALNTDINQITKKSKARSCLIMHGFFIFLMVQFIRGIPRELDEAAAIVGAGPIRIYFSIILPLLTPALVTKRSSRSCGPMRIS